MARRRARSGIVKFEALLTVRFSCKNKLIGIFSLIGSLITIPPLPSYSYYDYQNKKVKTH